MGALSISRCALGEAGVEILPGPFKAPNELRGMGLAHLSKSAKAIKELADKGMAP
jgi:hypothetical protein